MSEPIEFMQRRWKCPHCSRSRTRRTAIEEHIARCWRNPDNRTCKTCIFFLPASSSGGYWCIPGQPCSCNDADPECKAGVEFPDFAALPIVGCSKWHHEDEPLPSDIEPSTSPRS